MPLNLVDLSLRRWFGGIMLIVVAVFLIIYVTIHREEIIQEWKEGKWPMQYPRMEGDCALVEGAHRILQKFKTKLHSE